MNNDDMKNISLLDKRVETLEIIRLQEIRNQFVAAFDRLEKLEWIVDFIKSLLNETNKRPHKCPLCNGFGNQSINEHTAEGPKEHYRKVAPCHGCKGSGIVWS